MEQSWLVQPGPPAFMHKEFPLSELKSAPWGQCYPMNNMLARFPQRPGRTAKFLRHFVRCRCTFQCHTAEPPCLHLRQLSRMWLAHQPHQRKWNVRKTGTVSQQARLEGLERKGDLSNGGQGPRQPSLQEGEGGNSSCWHPGGKAVAVVSARGRDTIIDGKDKIAPLFLSVCL